MTEQNEDQKFEAWLKDEARAYHIPHPTPREEMWAKIQHGRRHKHIIELRPWMRWALAAAAVLVLGIGIGRFTANQPSPVPGAPTPVSQEIDSLANQAYRVAATQYLSRTEAFLTSFRTDADRSANTARLARQARGLLATTRLMLDSPAAQDPRLRSLLEDLELVLMQIALLNPLEDGHDRDLITQGMNQSNVLPKLRSAIPAGPVSARAQGAL